MVFDHHGDIVHHHMGGRYHGGDGFAMIDWVDRLLKDAPAIYLGREPFGEHARLAEQVSSGRDLKSALARLHREVDASDGEPTGELARIVDGVERWRDRELARIGRLLATRPSAAIQSLQELSREMGKSGLGQPVADRLQELDGSNELATAVRIEQSFAKLKARIDKLKPCSTCKRSGRESAAPTCSECAGKHRRAIEKTVEALDELVRDHARAADRGHGGVVSRRAARLKHAAPARPGFRRMSLKPAAIPVEKRDDTGTWREARRVIDATPRGTRSPRQTRAARRHPRDLVQAGRPS